MCASVFACPSRAACYSADPASRADSASATNVANKFCQGSGAKTRERVNSTSGSISVYVDVAFKPSARTALPVFCSLFLARAIQVLILNFTAVFGLHASLSSPTKTMSNLPQELIVAMVDNIQDDRKSLDASSLQSLDRSRSRSCLHLVDHPRRGRSSREDKSFKYRIDVRGRPRPTE